MFIPSINELTKIADSRYTLCMLTSKRSRQLIEGAKPLVKTSSTKPVSIAIEEIVQGEVKYKRLEIEDNK
ncbi:DNA-directed RNA polymerase subunit omega [Schnuerera sp. xch1]|uniref:DNA-directed RNA polymerase subunit omega n=1 Tax=Schnuerera sp. xch1 TaxID=2874283 RepID=UPI001CBD3D68|nr:DNA-directed RNA polymerase subunit omega [Schnuerera sp. xch1]MBZ2173933.1 DNA-directed RNA polymerase subunit omega [Schnuerera sp. xch1]